jgi:hypothetical protein
VGIISNGTFEKVEGCGNYQESPSFIKIDFPLRVRKIKKMHLIFSILHSYNAEIALTSPEDLGTTFCTVGTAVPQTGREALYLDTIIWD